MAPVVFPVGGAIGGLSGVLPIGGGIGGLPGVLPVGGGIGGFFGVLPVCGDIAALPVVLVVHSSTEKTVFKSLSKNVACSMPYHFEVIFEADPLASGS